MFLETKNGDRWTTCALIDTDPLDADERTPVERIARAWRHFETTGFAPLFLVYASAEVGKLQQTTPVYASTWGQLETHAEVREVIEWRAFEKDGIVAAARSIDKGFGALKDAASKQLTQDWNELMEKKKKEKKMNCWEVKLGDGREIVVDKGKCANRILVETIEYEARGIVDEVLMRIGFHRDVKRSIEGRWIQKAARISKTWGFKVVGRAEKLNSVAEPVAKEKKESEEETASPVGKETHTVETRKKLVVEPVEPPKKKLRVDDSGRSSNKEASKNSSPSESSSHRSSPSVNQ